MKKLISSILTLAVTIASMAIIPLASVNAVETTSGEYEIKYDASNRVIVSLGDSYSAGEGLGDYYDGEFDIPLRVKSEAWLSHRSKKSWPGQLKLKDNNGNTITMIDYDSDPSSWIYPASNKNERHWYFAAMSGAVTYDITNKSVKEFSKKVNPITTIKNNFEATGEIPPQIDIFKKVGNKKVDYVTMTLGGNDIKFVPIVIATALNNDFLEYSQANVNPLSKVSSVFNQPITKARLSVVLEYITHFVMPDTLTRLEENYKLIAEKAGSQAHIIIAGYPKLISESNNNPIFSSAEAELINKKISYFNQKVSEIVDKCRNEGINISFVSVEGEDQFGSHGAYSTDGEYINGITLTDWYGSQEITDGPLSGASFHPNEAGAKVYAKCVQDEIDRIEDQKTRIWGQVVDKNNNPISGVKVTLWNSNKISKTDKNGIYSFEVDYKRDNHYQLSFEKSGYKVLVAAEDKGGHRITINAKLKAADGIISGKVVTEDNKPIGNATVKCGDKTVKTNGNGEYTISLPSGNYYFEVSCDGYQTAKIANIAVQPGKTTNLNNIVLKKENAQDYKAAFIQALLDNESEWNKDEYDGLKLMDTYFFDVDFDGKPELLTKFGDHNYRTYKTYVYYYEDGLKKYKSPINDGMDNFEVYLDTKNQKHILRGKNFSGTMVGAGGTHYFDIEINRESSKSTLYACDSWIRDPSPREVTHTYYKYNNVTYTTLEEAYNSKIEITEDEYNKIMAEKSEGLEPVFVDYESLHSGDYGKYNAAQKKSALEKAYDSFCIVQRSDQIQYYNGKRYYTIEQNLNVSYPKFDFSQAKPDYVALPSLSGSIDGSDLKSSKFSFDNFIIVDDKIYFTKQYPFNGPCNTANLYVCDINGKNIALICEHVFSRFVYGNGNIYFQHENAGVYDSGTGSYGFERTNKDTYNIATGKITGHSHNFDLEFQGKIMEWWPNSVSDTRRYYDGAFYYVKSYPQEQDVNAGNMRLHLKTSDNKDYVVGRWWNQAL